MNRSESGSYPLKRARNCSAYFVTEALREPNRRKEYGIVSAPSLISVPIMFRKSVNNESYLFIQY